MTGPILTVPNVISAVRVAMVPLFLWLLFGADTPLAAGLLLGGIGATRRSVVVQARSARTGSPRRGPASPIGSSPRPSTSSTTPERP